jgi:hypothetical protein
MDTIEAVSIAQASNLNVAIFPSFRFPIGTHGYLITEAKEASWWEEWFIQYRRFLIHHADMAAQTGAGMLILGGEWIGPSLPGGLIINGTSSGVPSNVGDRWQILISDLRQRYGGRIYFALPYKGLPITLPAFMNDLDGLYLLWDAPLALAGRSTVDEMIEEASRLLESDIKPLHEDLQKPIVLTAAYPSVRGTASGCIEEASETCLGWTAIHQSLSHLQVDLDEQVDVYHALLLALNSRNWVSGVVSRGYYPPAALQDQSASIHGKPTEDLLLHWFSQLLGR